MTPYEGTITTLPDLCFAVLAYAREVGADRGAASESVCISLDGTTNTAWYAQIWFAKPGPEKDWDIYGVQAMSAQEAFDQVRAKVEPLAAWKRFVSGGDAT